MLNKSSIFVLSAVFVALAGSAQASSVSEREYKRGFADCSRGDYDQYQHGASYKRGCRAAEAGSKPAARDVNEGHLTDICRAAVIGKFHHYARTVRVANVEHQDFGWGVYGTAVMDDGATADFVCMFSSSGTFKRVNASEPIGSSTQMDEEGYCPPDVSEAERYKYPGCN